jgi:monoamine oxidase
VSTDTNERIVIVGAGLAGLSAALALHRAGVEVTVMEASDHVGGRTRTVSAQGHLIECGAEWLGPRHVHLRRLVDSLGLDLEPVRQIGYPVLWREPGSDRVSRLLPPGLRTDMLRALYRAGRLARSLDPCAPWTSPEAAALDERSVGSLLDEIRASDSARHYLGGLMEMLSGTLADELSLLHLLWWIRRANGPIRAFRATFDSHVVQGTQAIADQIRLRLGKRVVLNAPAAQIVQGAQVEVSTADGRTFSGRRAIVAAPWHGAVQPNYDPPLPPEIAALAALRSGPGIKVSGILPNDSKAKHRIALGGPSIKGAWRLGGRVSGYVPPTVAAPGDDALIAELASCFGLPPDALGSPTVMRWTTQFAAGGCDIGFTVGQLTQHGSHLRASHGLVHFAGVERSSWPNNMEGAVESGEETARRVMAELAR